MAAFIFLALALALRFGPPLLLSRLRPRPTGLLPPLELRLAGSVLALLAVVMLGLRAISLRDVMWLTAIALEAFWLAWQRGTELRGPDA